MSDLMTTELTLTGRLTTASNATFMGNIAENVVVYKPIAGENPLWDFPDGQLAHREVAAYLVSEALGWNIVPHTWLREAQFGEGMVQLWQEQDVEENAIDLVPAESVPQTGWKQVFQGRGENGELLALVHEDSPALRRMAVFDVIVNNADRKGNHILAMTGGHRYGVDHGLTFHREHKLRTVLWGWVGEALTDEEHEGVARISEALQAELGQKLAELITADELASLAQRCDHLLSTGKFPSPSGEMPAVPWPLF